MKKLNVVNNLYKYNMQKIDTLNIIRTIKSLLKVINIELIELIFIYSDDSFKLDNEPVYKTKSLLLYRYKNNWTDISKHQYLSEDFMIEFDVYLNWVEISKYQKLSENFIDKHVERINFYYLMCNRLIDDNYLIKLQDWVSEDFIKYVKVNESHINCVYRSEKFIITFMKYLTWYDISKCCNLSHNFIRKYKDKIVWCNITSPYILTIDFKIEFNEYFNQNA